MQMWSGGYFEDKLEEYRDYLDAELLEKFYRRIETAEKHEVWFSRNNADWEISVWGVGWKCCWGIEVDMASRQSGGRKKECISIDAFAWQAVRIVASIIRWNSKGQVSFQMFCGLSSVNLPRRYRSALGLMYEAFTQSQSDTVDIFDLAASLADGAEPPSKLLQEFVQKSEFIDEMEQILDAAEAADQELAERKASLISQRMEEDDQGKQYMSVVWATTTLIWRFL